MEDNTAYHLQKMEVQGEGSTDNFVLEQDQECAPRNVQNQRAATIAKLAVQIGFPGKFSRTASY